MAITQLGDEFVEIPRDQDVGINYVEVTVPSGTTFIACSMVTWYDDPVDETGEAFIYLDPDGLAELFEFEHAVIQANDNLTELHWLRTTNTGVTDLGVDWTDKGGNTPNETAQFHLLYLTGVLEVGDPISDVGGDTTTGGDGDASDIAINTPDDLVYAVSYEWADPLPSGASWEGDMSLVGVEQGSVDDGQHIWVAGSQIENAVVAIDNIDDAALAFMVIEAEYAGVLHTDDFERAGIGPDWENGPGWYEDMEIVSGELQSDTGGENGGIRRIAEIYDADQWSEGTLAANVADGGYAFVFLGVGTPTASAYYAFCKQTGGTKELELRRHDGSGGFTQVGSDANESGTWTAADVIKLQRIGNKLKIYVNDSLKLTETDSTYSGGQPGLGSYTSSDKTDARWESWRGGNVGAEDTEIEADVDALTLTEYLATISLIPTPSITDVDGDEAWNDGDTGLVITGVGFVN